MDSYLTLADAAHALAKGYSVAWRFALTGQLDAVKRGGRWYVSRQSLQRLARQLQEAVGTTDAEDAERVQQTEGDHGVSSRSIYPQRGEVR